MTGKPQIKWNVWPVAAAGSATYSQGSEEHLACSGRTAVKQGSSITTAIPREFHPCWAFSLLSAVVVATRESPLCMGLIPWDWRLPVLMGVHQAAGFSKLEDQNHLSTKSSKKLLMGNAPKHLPCLLESFLCSVTKAAAGLYLYLYYYCVVITNGMGSWLYCPFMNFKHREFLTLCNVFSLPISQKLNKKGILRTSDTNIP